MLDCIYVHSAYPHILCLGKCRDFSILPETVCHICSSRYRYGLFTVYSGVADTARKVFTFTVPTAKADITLKSVVGHPTYTVAAPTVTDGTNTVTGLKGLPVSAVADKASAKSGETVTVTVTISGKATGAVTLSLTDASWLAPSVPAGVTHTSGTVLTVANGTNLGDGVTVKCEFTVSSTVTTTNIALA